MKHQIPISNTIAISFSACIGDGLIGLVLANNFAKNGYNTTLFCSELISQLNSWQPNLQIIASNNKSATPEYICQHFDTVIAIPQGAPLYKYKGINADKIINISTHNLDRKKSFAKNMMTIANTIFGLSELTISPGLIPPAQLTKRKFKHRVILHPFSKNSIKNWPLEKYNQLARKLSALDYQPIFIMSPQEKINFGKFVDEKFLPPDFNNFIDLASFIYESGWMIGNDSGIGHLASALSIPTLSIFRKRNRVHYWQPAWAYGEVVTPPIELTYLVNKNIWKKIVSSERVLKSFQHLVENYSKTR